MSALRIHQRELDRLYAFISESTDARAIGEARDHIRFNEQEIAREGVRDGMR